MTRDDVSEFCVGTLAAVLKIPQTRVESDTKFSRLGLDSAMTVYWMLDLEQKFGVELSPDDFVDHPTINRLTDFLIGKLPTRSSA
jgi:acyl carrier protein